MATESHEFTGKTVDDAIAEGLKTLKLRPDQVDVEVISKGSRGIFGLGSEPAHVRMVVRQVVSAPIPLPPLNPPLPAPAIEHPAVRPETAVQPATLEEDVAAPKEAEQATDLTSAGVPADAGVGESDEVVETLAVDLLTQAVQLMGFTAQIKPTWKEGVDDLNEQGERYLLLDIQGADLGALIGRRGETLDSLQYLLRLMVNQRLHKWENVIVDVEGYKARRVIQLQQLALRSATQVAATGRSISLEPMPPNERRIIHIALRDHPQVFTESSGEGERRKVHIIAKN